MQPKEIKKKDHYIHILWEDDHQSIYELNYLRRKCPCASCLEIKKRTPDGGIDLPSFHSKPIEIIKNELVGRYAIQFSFSDQHNTGIYSFDHLRKICPCPICASKNLSGQK